MKTSISDIHNAHGSIITLSLKATQGDEKDASVIAFLHDQFRAVGEEISGGKRTFYIREISPIEDGLAITFSENPILMARVDFHYNYSRNDLKFPVLLLDERASEHDLAKHFICHWCKEEIWAVQREAVEVYVPGKRKMILVQVHIECQDIRNEQIAQIPFVDMR